MANFFFSSPFSCLKAAFPHYFIMHPSLLRLITHLYSLLFCFPTPQFSPHCSFQFYPNAILHPDHLHSSSAFHPSCLHHQPHFLPYMPPPSSPKSFLPLPPCPQFFLSMVLSLSLVIMVQITGGREAPHLGRGGNQTLQAGLCQQGGQPAAADRKQRETTVSKTPLKKDWLLESCTYRSVNIIHCVAE